MNHANKGWNTELLNQIFSEAKVKVIMRIPVSSMGAKDRLLWNTTRNGQYTIASGYQAAKVRKK